MFKKIIVDDNGQQTTDNRLCPQFSNNLNGKKAHCSQLIVQS